MFKIQLKSKLIISNGSSVYFQWQLRELLPCIASAQKKIGLTSDNLPFFPILRHVYNNIIDYEKELVILSTCDGLYKHSRHFLQ
jgi:hypothetical protein